MTNTQQSQHLLLGQKMRHTRVIADLEVVRRRSRHSAMNDEKALFIWQRCSGFDAVQTAFGTFHGRDCIFLDEFCHDEATGTVSLHGEVNGHLCRPPLSEQWAAYSLHFRGVIACEHTDLDAWTWHSNSCFDRVVGSAWLASFGHAIAATHAHFLVQTYDDVYDIIAERFDFQPGRRREQPTPE